MINNSNKKQILIGSLLVLAGLLFLFQQLFDLPVGALFFSLLFAAGACIFFYVVGKNLENWWAFIPGFTLLGLAVLIGSSALFDQFSDHSFYIMRYSNYIFS